MLYFPLSSERQRDGGAGAKKHAQSHRDTPQYSEYSTAPSAGARFRLTRAFVLHCIFCIFICVCICSSHCFHHFTYCPNRGLPLREGGGGRGVVCGPDRPRARFVQLGVATLVGLLGLCGAGLGRKEGREMLESESHAVGRRGEVR